MSKSQPDHATVCVLTFESILAHCVTILRGDQTISRFGSTFHTPEYSIFGMSHPNILRRYSVNIWLFEICLSYLCLPNEDFGRG